MKHSKESEEAFCKYLEYELRRRVILAQCNGTMYSERIDNLKHWQKWFRPPVIEKLTAMKNEAERMLKEFREEFGEKV